MHCCIPHLVRRQLIRLPTVQLGGFAFIGEGIPIGLGAAYKIKYMKVSSQLQFAHPALSCHSSSEHNRVATGMLSMLLGCWCTSPNRGFPVPEQPVTCRRARVMRRQTRSAATSLAMAQPTTVRCRCQPCPAAALLRVSPAPGCSNFVICTTGQSLTALSLHALGWHCSLAPSGLPTGLRSLTAPAYTSHQGIFWALQIRR